MHTSVVTADFQIELPELECRRIGISVGTLLQVLVEVDRIHLLPIRAPGSLRGFLRRTPADLDREGDRL